MSSEHACGWPSLPSQDKPQEASPRAAENILKEWNDIYARLFVHNMYNSTASASSEYIMTLLSKANEFIIQLVSEKLRDQTRGLKHGREDSGSETEETNKRPSHDKSEIETLQKYAWVSKTEREEACVFGEAAHLASDNDSTIDYGSRLASPMHIPESLDGGSDDELDPMELVDLRKPEDEEIVRRIERGELEAPSAGSTVHGSAETYYVWNPDDGEFVLVEAPYQTLGFTDNFHHLHSGAL